ncbi:MAG: phytanoyl-CoA dioxygenase family protein [Pseudomonadota bacterium]
MTGITHLPANTTPETIKEAIEDQGGVIVDNLISPAKIKRISDELAPYLEAGEFGREEFGGFQTKRIGALMAKSPECHDLALHPLINAACDLSLRPYCDSHQLHFTQAVSISKGEGAQTLHRDRGVWGPYLNRSIETQFSTIWAISEFTRENGATQFVPGSHKWDKNRSATDDEIAYAEMSPGSVLLYNGTVFHGGGANTTDTNRVGVLLHYTLNWLRQEENQYLSCPPDKAASLPSDLRRLMGYSLGGPTLGFYSTPGAPGEGRDLAPPEYLFGEKPNKPRIFDTDRIDADFKTHEVTD